MNRYWKKPYYFAGMAKKWITVLLLSCCISAAKSQGLESTVLNGEFGVALGAAHYFGDLNTRASINRPKIAASLLFRKQFGSYIALRAQGTFAQLGYSDIYSENETQRPATSVSTPTCLNWPSSGISIFSGLFPAKKDTLSPLTYLLAPVFYL
jgi:hypothetical protein